MATTTDIMPYANRVHDAAIRVETYKQYREIIMKWVSGKLDDTLVVIGSAGIGKTELARQSMGTQKHAYIKGQATRFGVYLRLLEYIHEPVVLDDIDSLLNNKEVTGLLKMLMETRTPRLIQWNTGATMIGDSGIPASFHTRSRTMVLANELKLVSKNFAAVLDRSTILEFRPTPKEIHEYVGTWFKDKEVYKYVGQRLHGTPSPSCRFYYHGEKWKGAGLDWKNMLKELMFPAASKALLCIELESQYPNAAARIEAWKNETGESAQAYWATKKAVDLRRGIPRSARAKAISEGMKKFHARGRGRLATVA